MNYDLHPRTVLAVFLLSVTIVFLLGSPALSAPLNTPPHFTNCPQEWLTTSCTNMVVYDFDAEDIDPGDDVTYYLGPETGGAINSITGVWEWGANDVGVYHFTIIAVDKSADSAFCEFIVAVGTEAPYFTGCPDDTNVTTVVIGGLIEGSVTAIDPDECPKPLHYSLVDFTGPGMFYLDSISGEWSWLTHTSDDFIGEFIVSIAVDDGAESDLCSFTINVLPTFDIWIGAELLQPQGKIAELPIYFSDETDYIAGFDFLVEYDRKMLTFIEAEMGSDLGPDGCAWEYFTYRYENTGGCGGSCPNDLLRFVALAEYDLSPPYPSCYAGDAIELLKMRFLVTGNADFQCKFSPVRFYWLDCGDNTVSSVSGDTLWLSSKVYYLDAYLTPVYLPVTGRHGIGGHTGIEGVDCLAGGSSSNAPVEGIIFRGGGIKTECLSNMIIYGDLNLNRTPNEVADVILFLAYFTYGTGVFTIDLPAQIEASDVNRDGRVLTSGDLVYMINILQGLPVIEPVKLAHFDQGVTIYSHSTVDGMVINSSSESEIGAIYMRCQIDESAPDPVLLSDDMQMKWNVSDGELRIVIYSMSGNAIHQGDNDIILLKNVSHLEIKDISASDRYGSILNTRHESNPMRSGLALVGNVPNPFNPSTEFRFYLQWSSGWMIEIFNITGQKVDEIDGYDRAGLVSVIWNAGNHPSGVYLYRITAGDDAVTGKMILMK